MTTDEYLKKILETQDLADDSSEMKDLEARRQEVEALLLKEFKGAKFVIRIGGSRAKGTLNRNSYDLDMIVCFASGENGAGETLEEIFNNVKKALEKKYKVREKTSAIRLLGDGEVDFHVDVVPCRFTDSTETDAYLHRTSGTKARLKTNPQAHIDHVRDSGVTSAIRLMKLWRGKKALSVKTFVLELLTIELLSGKAADSLEKQLIHVLTQLRDAVDDITIEDPANPAGNDLSDLFDETMRKSLAAAAKSTLTDIKDKGWTAVFGEVETVASKVQVLKRAAAQVQTQTKPWLAAR